MKCIHCDTKFDLDEALDLYDELEKICEKIAREIQTGIYDFVKSSKYEEPCAGDYLSDIEDYRFIMGSNGQYLGAHILLPFDGPNIWINTIDKCIEGFWGGDEVKRYYSDDNLGICYYMSGYL
jgi:hypothetical protein